MLTTMQPTTYNYLPEDIDELILSGESHRAIDDFFEKLASLSHSNEEKPINLYLLNGAQLSRMPPLNYIMNHLQGFEHHLSDSTCKGRVYAVILHPGPLAAVIRGFARMFPQEHVRIFRPEERDEALRWLQQQRIQLWNQPGGEDLPTGDNT